MQGTEEREWRMFLAEVCENILQLQRAVNEFTISVAALRLTLLERDPASELAYAKHHKAVSASQVGQLDAAGIEQLREIIRRLRETGKD